MTTGTDAGTAFTGGAGADTFNAAVLTANDNDILAGGAGADVLNLETASNITENFKTSGIETVNLNALGAVTVDAKNLSGMTALNSNDAAAAVTVNNIAATTVIGVKGSAVNTIDLNYTTGALNGSADKLTVNLNGSSATTVTADAGFESVEVNTTAASTLTTLTASGATALTLSGSATLTTADNSIDSFTDYTVTNTAKVTYNDIDTVKTFNASTNTGGIVGKDLNATATLNNGTTTDVLTMSSTGSLIQTGSGADNINVNTAALLSTNSAIIKLGDGNDILNLSAVGSSGEFVYAEAGDDTIYVGGLLTSSDLIDGGAGTDTVNFVTGTHALIAKGIENVKVEAATTVDFVTVDSGVAITDSGAAAVAFTNLKNGTTYSSTLAKTADLSLGFAASQAATINVGLTKGTTGAVAVTNVADLTVTYGAASNMGTNDITVDTAATKLTVAATGALIVDDIVSSGAVTTEKLQTITVTGNKAITFDDITNDASLTSVSVKSTGGDVVLGDIGAAANTADITVTKIEAITTVGKAVINDIDFSGAGTTVTGNIAEITATGVAGTAAATSIGAITADKLGTVTATSAVHNATIGVIVAGADTADVTDGTVTALKASGYLAASIGTVTADNVASILVESTDLVTGGAVSVGAIDGNTTGKMTIGTVDISSKMLAASTGTIKGTTLGNVTVTGGTTAATGAITIGGVANDGTSTMANVTVTAGSGAATLGAIDVETVGTITAKSTSAGVVVGAMTIDDTTGVTMSFDASTTITLAGAETIQNTKGDLTMTAKAGGAFAADAKLTVDAGTAGTTTDIDILVDATTVVGNVGATGGATDLTVTNQATDSASSIIVKGGSASNWVTLDGDGGTITYYGQTGVDTVTLLGTYTTSTIYGEAGADVIVGGAGVDTIYGGAAIDTITSGTGSDNVYLGASDAVADIVVTTIGAAYTTAAADKIYNVEKGAAGDIIKIDISDSTAIANLDILTAGDGATAITGDLVIKTVAKGAGATALANTDEILVLTGTYADSAAVLTDIGSAAGTTAISWGTNPTATSGLLVVFYDGTNSHIIAVSDADTANNVGMLTTELAATEIVTLMGVDTTGFNTVNFTAIA